MEDPQLMLKQIQLDTERQKIDSINQIIMGLSTTEVQTTKLEEQCVKELSACLRRIKKIQ
jgi:hypothetical protein